MKKRESAGAVPAKTAGERGYAWKSEDARCRQPERFRVRKMVRVPVNEGFGRAEAALWSAAVTSYGTIMAAPLWWDIDGLRVLGWWAVGCAAVYAVLRGATVIPGTIRKIRKVLRRREPEWLIPVYSVRGRDSFGGYVPREAICRAAKGNR